ncbi:hypothetical protein [Streptomyces sp. NPDC059850]|uniref:hypothetical protein n=1 Tax=Streptomyces sp. NPDC059850 TaxID=3346970 RepID=UPI003667E675
MTVTPERPTSADWWVTADQSLTLVGQYTDAAHTAPDLLATLSRIGEASRATDHALGAAVHALLASGRTWDEIADALGHPDAASARRATGPALEGARRALDRRIGRDGISER